MIEMVKVEYAAGYVDVEIKKCGHCGVLPTAVDRDLQKMKGCAVCGGKAKLYPKATLYHSVEDREKGPGGWILCGVGSGSYDPDLSDKSFLQRVGLRPQVQRECDLPYRVSEEGRAGSSDRAAVVKKMVHCKNWDRAKLKAMAVTDKTNQVPRAQDIRVDGRENVGRLK